MPDVARNVTTMPMVNPQQQQQPGGLVQAVQGAQEQQRGPWAGLREAMQPQPNPDARGEARLGGDRPGTRPQEPAPTIGGLSTEHTLDYLMNPGQVSPVMYERAQEQANIGLNAAGNAGTTQLSGRGVDPGSPMGQLMSQSAGLNSQKIRNEAARDQSILEEQMRRQDIQAGIGNYMNFLTQIMQLMGIQVGVASGNAFPQVAPVDPYAGVNTGIGMLNQGLQDVGQRGGGGPGQNGNSQYGPWADAYRYPPEQAQEVPPEALQPV
jgi:hypothetical protein